jgi:hypothetical protein
MEKIVIVGCWFLPNRVFTVELLRSFYKDATIVGYDDFNTGADICGYDKLMAFIKNNKDKQIYYYETDDGNIQKFWDFKQDNFKLIHTDSLLGKKQFSKTEQFKFLEMRMPEILPEHQFLESGWLLKEGVSSGGRKNFEMTDDCMLVKKIDAVRAWTITGVCHNGIVLDYEIGETEGIYWNSLSTWISYGKDVANPKIKEIYFNLAKHLNIDGIADCELLETANGELLLTECNFRPNVTNIIHFNDGVKKYLEVRG